MNSFPNSFQPSTPPSVTPEIECTLYNPKASIKLPSNVTAQFSQGEKYSKKRPGYPGRFSDFLMRGGDNEFINYLKYILQGKCVQSVYEF